MKYKLLGNEEKYVLRLTQRVEHGKNPISSRRTTGCFALIIGREGGNVLDNAVFLHTTLVAKEVHLIHLFLLLHLQLLLLRSRT